MRVKWQLDGKSPLHEKRHRACGAISRPLLHQNGKLPLFEAILHFCAAQTKGGISYEVNHPKTPFPAGDVHRTANRSFQVFDVTACAVRAIKHRQRADFARRPLVRSACRRARWYSFGLSRNAPFPHCRSLFSAADRCFFAHRTHGGYSLARGQGQAASASDRTHRHPLRNRWIIPV
ncbi:hypothetical protein SDC9_109884 [bioreactor metagenome]|uniref:Uncharacterized protein n=1 Tax=bioreactor metagenome TaxID=1076179 RepID=A0A645BD36_9ZZZZ